jgi:transcriptional regulator with XRE-family HTH domain
MAGPRDPHDVALARAIQKLRKEAGLTQEQLADRAEIPAAALQQVEAATIEADWGTLRHIATGLGTSLSGLFQLVEELEEDEDKRI